MRVLFSGLDGAGKTSSMDTLIQRLSTNLRVLRIGTTGFEIYDRGTHEHRINSQMMEALGEKLRGGPLYGFWLMANFLYKQASASFFASREPSDVVFYETDTMLNPSVYLSYHFPRFCRLVSARTRFSLMSLLFGSPRDTLIFYLDVDPDVSMARCLEREAKGGPVIEPHQTLESMQALKREFDEVAQAAIDKGYDLVQIKTTSLTLDEVCREAEAALRARQ